MRTLKKTLCLVLCLAMMVGLCAVGASAVHFEDYPDKAEIKHVEAATLLTELGIMEGTLEGFEPTKGLTRAEAAALIVRLQNVDPTGLSSTFKDMQGHWAQPYVGWLQAQGIVEGTGSGNFEPDAVLTFVDFAAMLLRTLGYDKERELMTGKTYELGVLKLVNKLNLAHGIRGWEYNKPINRDDAAQLAFNALRLNMVDYKENALDNVSVDENGNLLPGLRENIPNTAYSYISADGKKQAGRLRREAEGGSEQMIERFWPKVKLYTERDDFGIPQDKWFTGVDTVDYKYTDDKAICIVDMVGVMAEYTVEAGTILLSQVYADANLTEPTDVVVLENGGLIDDITLAKNSKDPLNYGGATVLLLDTDDDAEGDTLIVKYPYLARVTGIIPADESVSGDREIELTIYNGYGENKKVDGVTYATDLFSKGDFVLVYPKWPIGYTATLDDERFNDPDETEIIQVSTAEVLEGKLTKYGKVAGAVASMTVAGEKHDIAKNSLAKMGIKDTYPLNKGTTLYMNNGYVLGISSERPSYTSYVFTVNYGYNTTEDVTLIGADKDDIEWKVGYVKQDGTTGIAVVANDKLPDPVMGWQAPSQSRGLTQFTHVNNTSDAAYEIDAVIQGKTISSKNAFYGYDGTYTINADAKTEFIIYTNKSYAHYTGVNNLPTYAGEGDVNVYALMVDNIAVAILIDGRGTDLAPAAATNDKIFLLSTAYFDVEYDEANATNVYSYSAIVGGKFGSFKSTEASFGNIVAGQLFEPTMDKNGYVTGVKSTVALRFGTVTVSYGTLVIELDEGDRQGYVTTDSTKVFYYDANGKAKRIEAGEASEISGKGTFVTLVFAPQSTTVLSEVYVYTPRQLQ